LQHKIGSEIGHKVQPDPYIRHAGI